MASNWIMRIAAFGVLCGMWTACDPEVTSADQRDQYAKAIASYGASAEKACKTLSDQELRGDCETFHAVHFGMDHGLEAGAKRCRAIRSPVWRGECLFMLSDGFKLGSERARDWCQDAVPFEKECVEHSAQRSLQQVEREFGIVGNEAALHAQLLVLTHSFAPNASEEKVEVTADWVLAHLIAMRMGDQRFTLASCGQSSERICGLAYRVLSRRQQGQEKLASFCEGPISAYRAAGHALRPWGETAAEVVQGEWERICREQHRKTWRDLLSPPESLILPVPPPPPPWTLASDGRSRPTGPVPGAPPHRRRP